MSNNIIIQENGIDKQIDADKLRLMLMSGNLPQQRNRNVHLHGFGRFI